MLQKLGYKFLRSIDPEIAHEFGKWGIKRNFFAPGHIEGQNPLFFCGQILHHNLALAAGFDKNGELVEQLVNGYSFAYVEVGSVTYHGGNGNPKPRLFRLSKPDDVNYGLLNRMGLNGDPAEVIYNRLSKYHPSTFAVNIAKTHNPDIMGDKAIEDILNTYKLVRSLGMYTAINISCPNTKEGKTFEDPAALDELLSALKPYRLTAKHLFVKISPNLSFSYLRDIYSVCSKYDINGYIACNTLPAQIEPYGKGGQSGKELFTRSLNAVKDLRILDKNTYIVGCGGVDSYEKYQSFVEAGASIVQAYTGFVIGSNAGPNFVHSLLRKAGK